MDTKINAIAHVKLTKKDDTGKVVEVIEHDVQLTEEEAKAIWHSQQPE